MIKMLKVIIHDQRCRFDDDETLGPNGKVRETLEEAIGAPIGYTLYRGFLHEERIEKLLEDCKNADLVILDHETHPTYFDWNDSWGKEPTWESLRIAKLIQEQCPEAKLFSPYFHYGGPKRLPIHDIAQPITHHNCQEVLDAFKELATQLL